MRRKILLTTISLILSLLSFAQFFIIKGKVTNSSQQPLPGASVTCKNSSHTKINNTTTTDNGEFQFADLTKGTYEIEVEYVGHTLYRTSIKLTDDNKTLVIELKEKTDELQTVNVFSKINSENESSSRISE